VKKYLNSILVGVIVGFFPLVVTLSLSDPIHSLRTRAEVALPVYPIWVITFFLIFEKKNFLVLRLGLAAGYLSLAVWSCRLDYSMINRLIIYGLPFLLLNVTLIGFLL
jgi:hypothetical protein